MYFSEGIFTGPVILGGGALTILGTTIDFIKLKHERSMTEALLATYLLSVGFVLRHLLVVIPFTLFLWITLLLTSGGDTLIAISGVTISSPASVSA